MSAMASQITSLTIIYWTVYSGANQRKYQSSASLAFVRGIHRWIHNRDAGDLRCHRGHYDVIVMGRTPVFNRLTWTTTKTPLIARFMGPTWGPSEADRTQVGPIFATWTLLSGVLHMLLLRQVRPSRLYDQTDVRSTGKQLNLPKSYSRYVLSIGQIFSRKCISQYWYKQRVQRKSTSLDGYYQSKGDPILGKLEENSQT